MINFLNLFLEEDEKIKNEESCQNIPLIVIGQHPIFSASQPIVTKTPITIPQNMRMPESIGETKMRTTPIRINATTIPNMVEVFTFNLVSIFSIRSKIYEGHIIHSSKFKKDWEILKQWISEFLLREESKHFIRYVVPRK